MDQHFSELKLILFVSPPDISVLIPGTKSNRSHTFCFGISPLTMHQYFSQDSCPTTRSHSPQFHRWLTSLQQISERAMLSACPLSAQDHSLGRPSSAVHHQRRLFLNTFLAMFLNVNYSSVLSKGPFALCLGYLKKSIPILIPTGEKEPRSLTMHEHRKFKKI